MNSMERVLKCLNHEEADRVPNYPIVAGAARRLIDCSYPEWSTNAEKCAESLILAQKEFGLDCLVTLIDLSVECAAWGQELVFPPDDAAHPNYSNQVIQDIDDYEKIKYVDYRTCDRMMMHIDVCRRCVEAANGEYPVVAFVFGPMGTLSMLRSQQEMYMDVYDDMDIVREAGWEIEKTLKEYSGALLDVGVNGIMYDTLFSSGSIMSKDMWDEMEGDMVQDLAEYVHGRGGLVMIHNCGGKIYFDAQINRMHPEAISFLFPTDDAKDLAEVKELYGDKTTLIGCVDPTHATLVSLEEWEQECKESVDAMAKGGGFVLATGCEFPSGADFAYAKKMLEVAETYGRYDK